ncbi:MAG: hypothetical protein R2880_15490 [Deinococcales bacterium]
MLHSLSALTLAQSASFSHCDPALKSPSENDLAYRDRPSESPDRCEGFYVQQVSGSFRFTGFFDQLHYEGDSLALELSWSVPQLSLNADTVYLRAQIEIPRVYYRMDRKSPSSDTSFTWKTSELLSANDMQQDDFGILAWIRPELDIEGLDKLYLPLNAISDNTPDPQQLPKSQGYYVSFISGAELDEVYISLSRFDEVQKVYIPTELQKVALEYGYYSADQAIYFSLPFEMLGESGFYHVTLSAKVAQGGLVSDDFWFFHP